MTPELFKNVDGIYIFDLDTYIPEIVKLHQQVDLRKIVCVGHELSANIVKYIKDDIVTACIRQDAHYQGYKAVRQLFECIFGESVPDKVNYDVKFDIIMAENVDQYIDQ